MKLLQPFLSWSKGSQPGDSATPVIAQLGTKADSRFHGRFKITNRVTLSGEPAGGFTVANVTFLTRNWKKGPSLSLSIFNLFDRKYGDPGGAEHVQNLIPQDGRSFRLQVRYEF